MIGVMKCCGVGARVLRGVAPTMESSNFGNVFEDLKSVSHSQLNWSQKRFLRGQPSSSSIGIGNVNSQFVVREIENQCGRNGGVLTEANEVSLESSLNSHNLRRSLRGHQSWLTSMYNNDEKDSEELIAEVSKIVSEDELPTARVKSSKDEELLQEWLGVQNELRTIKKDRIEEYKKKLQIAGQQALREMEMNIRKSVNLDDLDQAIEGALCSQAKTSNDN